MSTSRILIGACASGSGKTTVTCALLMALKQQALRVHACKCGPDYIDPMFHERVLGIPSRNLDPFFADKDLLQELFCRQSKDCDVTVIEGVMGYYDGISFTEPRASTYDVAKTIKAPVILVVNAKGMALTLVALLKGMLSFRSDHQICGVILNRVSKMTYQRLAPIIEREVGIRALGYLPECPEVEIGSRHLGLLTPQELRDVQERLEKLGTLARESLEIEEILTLADQATPLHAPQDVGHAPKGAPVRLAIARDEAFCFYYEDNLDLLRQLGCELIPFEPLRDPALPGQIDGLLLGGGYPECYGAQLEGNAPLRQEIRKALLSGLPCLAECGGFMYLHEQMEDTQGVMRDMVGLLSANACTRKDHLVRFGYITLSATGDNPLLLPGEEIRAHEFHYWDSTDNGNLMRADKPSGTRSWPCMHSVSQTICGYPHLYFLSNPAFAERFVALCRAYREQENS
ncbi:MAG: cobyrinate a,c-diamide synthase [Lachnospiraceae bacterium]|nr:cobyrinate a,c-diamide synthase [Lachnospiraceae bacterium]